MGGSAGNSPAFPTLLEAFGEDKTDNRDFVFDFVRLSTEYTDTERGTYKATFWVTGDALKYRIPKSRTLLYHVWNQGKPVPDLYDPQGEMLCRLPARAVDQQKVADLITTHPNGQGATSGLSGHKAPVRPDMKPLGSLLLTPFLYDQRFRERPEQPLYGKPQILEIEGPEVVASRRRHRIQTSMFNQDTSKNIVEESAKLHRALNAEINGLFAASGLNAFPSIVATAGKCWAVTNAIYKPMERLEKGKVFKYKAVVNYGWHGPAHKSLAVTHTPARPFKIVQSVGTAHDEGHTDYSQMAYLVAGWCEVTEPGAATPKFMETETVYRTLPYCGLATHDAVPLTVVRY